MENVVSLLDASSSLICQNPLFTSHLLKTLAFVSSGTIVLRLSVLGTSVSSILCLTVKGQCISAGCRSTCAPQRYQMSNLPVLQPLIYQSVQFCLQGIFQRHWYSSGWHLSWPTHCFVHFQVQFSIDSKSTTWKGCLYSLPFAGFVTLTTQVPSEYFSVPLKNDKRELSGPVA